MNVLSIPAIVVASVTFYVGCHHLLIYFLQGREARENLTFALTCIAVGFYDVFSAGLYSATSLVEGALWQRAQVTTLAFVALFFLWFIVDYLSITSKRYVYAFSIFFLLAVFVGLVDQSGLAWPIDQPAIKDIRLPFGYGITYYEMTPGPFVNLQSVMGLAAMFYVLWVAFGAYRRGQARRARPLMLFLGLFFLGAVNDTAVSSGLYAFVYMIEYTYMSMVLLMTFSLTRGVVEAALVKEALQEKEEKYRKLFEFSPEGIALLGLDGTILDCNDVVAHIASKPKDELIGKPFTELGVLHEEDLPRYLEIFTRVIGGEAVDPIELQVIGGENIPRWLEVYVTLLRKDEAIYAIQVITRDITSRVKTSAELERLLSDLEHRNVQLKTVVEISKSVSTILDPAALIQKTVDLLQVSFDFYFVGLFLVEEGGQYAVIRAGTGEAGSRMVAEGQGLQISGESTVGRCIADARALIALDIGELAEGFDNPLLPRTRSELVTPLISRGRCIGALSVQSDKKAAFTEDDIVILGVMAEQVAIAIENARLYERVHNYASELEQRVAERTAELTAVNEELEAFAYSVSHDLRAPLRAIDGFSQVLLEDYRDHLDEEGQDYLRRVQTASRRMGQLISDLLKLSRLTRGGMQYERVNLSAMAGEIAVELKKTHAEREIEFALTPEMVVDGDERLLHIALLNLLENACKFTGKRARAEIEFGYTEREGSRVYFVRDNGIGFDMAYVDKLFSAFQRLHSASEFEGTGIGLATAQRVIHRHGGRIWAEGQVDLGAVFYFTLGPHTLA